MKPELSDEQVADLIRTTPMMFDLVQRAYALGYAATQYAERIAELETKVSLSEKCVADAARYSNELESRLARAEAALIAIVGRSAGRLYDTDQVTGETFYDLARAALAEQPDADKEPPR